jgi:1-acyl-sn-glycerol-3-phosphate acyltransferase
MDVVAARAGLRTLGLGWVLCVFPEGGLSNVGRRGLGPGKAGAALLALRSRVPVYPVFISGGPRTNALLQSWILPSSKAVHVTYGPPLDLSRYYDRPITRRLLEEVTQLIMRTIAELETRKTMLRISARCEEPGFATTPPPLAPSLRQPRPARASSLAPHS